MLSLRTKVKVTMVYVQISVEPAANRKLTIASNLLIDHRADALYCLLKTNMPFF